MMEKIIVHAKFHTGHRQIGYPGKCRFVHGHTWRGTITVSTDEFPRDELDMALDFGDLKRVLRNFDHKILVVESDREFMDPELFEPEGIVVLPGQGPSVENVAVYAWDEVKKLIGEKFPNQDKTYEIEVQIQETENNFFIVAKQATI